MTTEIRTVTIVYYDSEGGYAWSCPDEDLEGYIEPSECPLVHEPGHKLLDKLAEQYKAASGFDGEVEVEPVYIDPTEDDADDMDGDHESALASAGWGTDEDYGCYNDYDYGDDY